MKYLTLLTVSLTLFATVALAAPVVEMQTNQGTIKIELNVDKAPLTVENFLNYVDQKFYDGTVFHRIIGNFMIQGGGFNQQEERKITAVPIKNEAENGLKNNRGTIAMARTGVVDSATCQFFINLVDNDMLNYRGSTSEAFGYAVFGKVIEGMDVVERIGSSKTITKNSHFRDYPQPQVIIESIRRIE